jgi:glutaminase
MHTPHRRLIHVWFASLLLAGAQAANAGDRLERVVDAAYDRHVGVDDGENARYIPALAKADPDRFGIVVVTVDGEVVTRGDTKHPFAIMSAAKPFTLALLLQQRGPDAVLDKVGVEPTGLPFNALDGIDRSEQRPMNPMVNAGAITTVSLIRADGPEQRWELIRDYYGRLAGEPLALMEDVYQSVSTSNYHNRAIINLLQEHRWLDADPKATLDTYNRQSCVAVTARQLAVMGATLANGGINPITGARVLEEQYVDEILSVMLLSGFYDESGRWAYRAGLPAKSGVGGGIVAVVPGEMAIVGFSPRLSPAGNSVRGAGAVEYIARELELSLFR